MTLDHVALLVRSLESALERLAETGLAVGEIESFPSEGTREVYLGDPDLPGRLLLLESTGPGPYQRAFEKRGPGLHHVAIEVADPDAFAADARGWLLHPHSLQSQKGANTLWFARPGVGALLEVTRGKARDAEPQVQVGVSLDDASLKTLLDLAPGLHAAERGASWIEVAGAPRVELADLS